MRTSYAKFSCFTLKSVFSVLAVGYKTGRILLCHVENSAMLHDLQFTSPVTSMTWVSESLVSDSGSGETAFFQDSSAQYLPKLPSYTKRYPSVLIRSGGMNSHEKNTKLFQKAYTLPAMHFCLCLLDSLFKLIPLLSATLLCQKNKGELAIISLEVIFVPWLMLLVVHAKVMILHLQGGKHRRCKETEESERVSTSL